MTPPDEVPAWLVLFTILAVTVKLARERDWVRRFLTWIGVRNEDQTHQLDHADR